MWVESGVDVIMFGHIHAAEHTYPVINAVPTQVRFPFSYFLVLFLLFPISTPFARLLPPPLFHADSSISTTLRPLYIF